MDDVVAFLNRMLDADELIARAARDEPESDWWWSEDAESAPERHIARHDPARVLADVAAKRAILNRAVRMVDSFNAATDAPWPDASRRERSHAVETIHDLAAAYADHEQFREEWRV